MFNQSCTYENAIKKVQCKGWTRGCFQTPCRIYIYMKLQNDAQYF